MNQKKIIQCLKLCLLSMLFCFLGCRINQQSTYQATLASPTAPREGWATDPNLSYALFSYYPINYLNPTPFGTYGMYGLYNY